MARSSLFEEPTKVSLRSNKDVAANKLAFPQAAYPGDLPSLLRVSSSNNGRTLITGTGSWGNPSEDPIADSVRANPDLIRALRRSNDLPERHTEAVIRRARFYDIVIYARGFWTKIWVALLGAAVGIAGAAVSFETDWTKHWYAPLLLTLVCAAEIIKAFVGIKD